MDRQIQIQKNYNFEKDVGNSEIIMGKISFHNYFQKKV